MKFGFVLSTATFALAIVIVASGRLDPLPARAAALLAPLMTGSSANPILGVSNTGTGEAIDGTAASNYGIVGRTNYSKSTQTTHYGGIGGLDASGGTARSYNTGVFGMSPNGNGILGTTAFNGWNSTTIFPTAGVYGGDISTKTLNGYSLESGVYGSSSYGNGVFGFAQNGTGVRGQTNAASTTLGFAGLYGVDGNSTTTSQNAGIFGYSKASAAVYGSSGSGFGIYAFSATGQSVHAETNGTGTALRLISSGTGRLATASNGSVEVMSLDNAGNLILRGAVTQHGSPTIARTLAAGATVLTHAVEATSPTIEQTGESRLIGGRATVSLPGDFAATIDTRLPYLVFITPEGLASGALCVTSRAASSFVVTESNGGRSNLAFAFRIVAHPRAEASTSSPSASPELGSTHERPGPAIPLRTESIHAR